MYFTSLPGIEFSEERLVSLSSQCNEFQAKKRPSQFRAKIISHKLLYYGLYRNRLYETRVDEKKIDEDMKNHLPLYLEKDKTVPPLNQKEPGLYRYAIKVALGAVREDEHHSPGDVKIIKARYHSPLNKEKPDLVGFIMFYASTFQGKPVVYIDHVTSNYKGVGRALMQSVIALYPEGTKFTLCVRQSNKRARHLYETLGFFYDKALVEGYGYDKCYFEGMHYTSTFEAIDSINKNLCKTTPVTNEKRLSF